MAPPPGESRPALNRSRLAAALAPRDGSFGRDGDPAALLGSWFTTSMWRITGTTWGRSRALPGVGSVPRRIDTNSNRRPVRRWARLAAGKEGANGGTRWFPRYRLPGLDSNQQPSG